MPPMTGGGAMPYAYASMMPDISGASGMRPSNTGPTITTAAKGPVHTPGAFHDSDDEEEVDYEDSDEEEEILIPVSKPQPTSAAAKAAAARATAASTQSQTKGKGQTPVANGPSAAQGGYGGAQTTLRSGVAQPATGAMPAGKGAAGYPSNAPTNFAMPYGNYTGADLYPQFSQQPNLKMPTGPMPMPMPMPTANGKGPVGMAGPGPYGAGPLPMPANPYMMNQNGPPAMPYPMAEAARPPPPLQRPSSSSKPPGPPSSSKRSSQNSHRRSRSGSTIEVKGWERTRPRPTSGRPRTTSSADGKGPKGRPKSGEMAEGDGRKKSSNGGGKKKSSGNAGVCVIL